MGLPRMPRIQMPKETARTTYANRGDTYATIAQKRRTKNASATKTLLSGDSGATAQASLGRKTLLGE